jgi:hypothetical protein
MDTVDYENELVWQYIADGNGGLAVRLRESDPEYARHCFVVARTVRQFFGHARFDPEQPSADDETYRQLIRRIVAASPARNGSPRERVVIPGYAHLREFSRAHETLLKQESGGWWQSYLQRGNWRMILPFPRWHQGAEAERLVRAIARGEPPIVHVVRFPNITINHALLLFEVERQGEAIRFEAYDPNTPQHPRTLTFDQTTRRFLFPETHYFAGGPVNVYQIYHSLFF